MLGHVPVGAGKQHAVVRVMRAGGPDLLPVDDPLVAPELGPGGAARQVGAAAGLAEELWDLTKEIGEIFAASKS